MEVKRNKLRRKSYAREFKLTVVTWFHENGKNVHQTSQHFNLDRKQVRNWVKAEEKIRKQKLMQRHQVEGRKLVSLKQKSNYTTNFLKCILKATQ